VPPLIFNLVKPYHITLVLYTISFSTCYAPMYIIMYYMLSICHKLLSYYSVHVIYYLYIHKHNIYLYIYIYTYDIYIYIVYIYIFSVCFHCTIVHCTLYKCTMYKVHCMMYKCIMYNVHTLYIVYVQGGQAGQKNEMEGQVVSCPGPTPTGRGAS